MILAGLSGALVDLLGETSELGLDAFADVQYCSVLRRILIQL